jgi:hypothetical protein
MERTAITRFTFSRNEIRAQHLYSMMILDFQSSYLALSVCCHYCPVHPNNFPTEMPHLSTIQPRLTLLWTAAEANEKEILQTWWDKSQSTPTYKLETMSSYSGCIYCRRLCLIRWESASLLAVLAMRMGVMLLTELTAMLPKTTLLQHNHITTIHNKVTVLRHLKWWNTSAIQFTIRITCEKEFISSIPFTNAL